MTEYFAGNHVHLLYNGAGYFPALLAAINGANHSVHLEAYIFEPDRTGLDVANALMDAARRGVSVNLVIDGFGACVGADYLTQRVAMFVGRSWRL